MVNKTVFMVTRGARKRVVPAISVDTLVGEKEALNLNVVENTININSEFPIDRLLQGP